VSASGEHPRVSVIVPTYRRPGFLLDTLASILSGSYSDFEVLVANDGPAEDVVAAQARFPDSRIEWLNRPERLGVGRNNIDAFRRARGEYIANLHDDDQWAPAFLSTLVPILEDHPDVVVAFADHFVVNEQGVVDEMISDRASRHWGRSGLAEGVHRPFLEIAAVDQSISIPSAAVFRRSAVNLADYPDEIGQCYDVWTAYMLARSGGAAWYVPQRLTYYRAHSDNYSHNPGARRAAAVVYFRQRLLDDGALTECESLLKRRLAGDRRHLAVALARDGRLGEARWQTRRAARLDPSPRTIALAAAVHVAPGLTRRALERRRRVLAGSAGSD